MDERGIYNPDYAGYMNCSAKPTEKIEEEQGFFDKRKLKIALGVLLFGGGMFLFSKALFFVVLFVFLNILMGFIFRGLGFASMIGFEVVTLSTVLVGAAYGPWAGVFMGVIGRIIEAVASRRYFSLVITLPLYAIVGYAAGAIGGGNIVLLGIVITVIYALIASFLSLTILEASPARMMFFGLTQVMINIFFFINLAPPLFSIMHA